MNEEIELECEYCGRKITENDSICPNCGANCSYMIKKYKKEIQKKEMEKLNENKEHNKQITEDLNKTLRISKIVLFATFIIILLIIISTL